MTWRRVVGIAVLVLVVFSAGVDSGLVWHRYLDPGSADDRSRPRGRRPSTRMISMWNAGELALSDTQRRQIETILKDRDEVNARIKSVLSPEQRQRLESLLSREQPRRLSSRPTRSALEERNSP
jgi:uncharacterized membrane protein